MIPYQAAVLRYRYSALTGEEQNIGVVLFLPGSGELVVRLNEDDARVKGAFPEMDGPRFTTAVRRMQVRFEELEPATEVKNIEDVTRALLPEDAAAFRWSPEVLAGLCVDGVSKADELLQEFVARFSAPPTAAQ